MSPSKTNARSLYLNGVLVVILVFKYYILVVIWDSVNLTCRTRAPSSWCTKATISISYQVRRSLSCQTVPDSVKEFSNPILEIAYNYHSPTLVLSNSTKIHIIFEQTNTYSTEDNLKDEKQNVLNVINIKKLIHPFLVLPHTISVYCYSLKCRDFCHTTFWHSIQRSLWGFFF